MEIFFRKSLTFDDEFSIIPNKMNIDNLLLTIDKGDRIQNGEGEDM
jgi:hypothetical protein